eukprot:357476-Chlamydomonas_euryale.AAC.3
MQPAPPPRAQGALELRRGGSGVQTEVDERLDGAVVAEAAERRRGGAPPAVAPNGGRTILGASLGTSGIPPSTAPPPRQCSCHDGGSGSDMQSLPSHRSGSCGAAAQAHMAAPAAPASRFFQACYEERGGGAPSKREGGQLRRQWLRCRCHRNSQKDHQGRTAQRTAEQLRQPQASVPSTLRSIRARPAHGRVAQGGRRGGWRLGSAQGRWDAS